METERKGSPAASNEAWVQDKQHWLTAPLQDVLDAAPKLSTEMRALLLAISELLVTHGEQLKVVLQAQERQIIQAMEDVKYQSEGVQYTSQSNVERSRSVRPTWTTEVRRPHSLEDNQIVTLPIGEAPEITPVQQIWETSTFGIDESAWQCPENDEHYESDSMWEKRKSDRSVTDLLPEFMKKKTSTLMGRWRSQKTGSRMTKDLTALSHTSWCSKKRAQNFLSSRMAEVLVTVGIVLNAANIGIEADWAVKNPSSDTPPAFQVANTCFSIFFAAELLLRIYAYRSAFFSCGNRDFSWNMFDTFLVTSAIVDDAIAYFVSAPNFTVIRVLRVFRLVRVIRVVRMLRFFQDLRVIVAGIGGAMKSMLWAVALLFMMMFLVSVCLLQLTAFELEEMDAAGRDAVLLYYGSLLQSIYTLYQSITGGLDWGDAAHPLLDMNPFLAIMFSFYIAFSVLCVLNIITGVFVENASSISYADDEQLVIDDFEERIRWFEEVKKLFTEMVGDKGTLDSEHFNMLLDDFKVQAYFRKLGIDVHETSKKGLFQILDFDGTGSLDLEEFALGLQMLHGPAKSIDLARIRCDLKKLKKDLQDISSSMTAGLTGDEKRRLGKVVSRSSLPINVLCA